MFSRFVSGAEFGHFGFIWWRLVRFSRCFSLLFLSGIVVLMLRSDNPDFVFVLLSRL